MFKEISSLELNCNPCRMIGREWMLVTAESEGKTNTMTAAWGGLGNMWNKDVAFVVVRPQRYTHDFIENSDTFSLTFFDDSFRAKMSYLGKVSGRDEDKIKNAQLTLCHDEAAPYFKEARTVLICKKLYVQRFERQCFCDASLDEKWYEAEDYHDMYIAEITTVLVNE